jgi:hypothetical protein
MQSKKLVLKGKPFLGFYEFLSSSYRRYGISGYYEGEADWLCAERRRIESLLMSVGGAKV